MVNDTRIKSINLLKQNCFEISVLSDLSVRRGQIQPTEHEVVYTTTLGTLSPQAFFLTSAKVDIRCQYTFNQVPLEGFYSDSTSAQIFSFFFVPKLNMGVRIKTI